MRLACAWRGPDEPEQGGIGDVSSHCRAAAGRTGRLHPRGAQHAVGSRRGHPLLSGGLRQRAAPPSLYAALVRAVNDAAREVRLVDANVPRFVSLQVDVAWGRLQGTTTYIGAEQDFRDFAFVEWVGLSSYPYLAGFDEPSQLPDEWYVRPLGGRTLPSLITEGGWTSAAIATIRSTPEKQARWITRQQQLADRLRPRYLFQLTFADLSSRVFGTDARLQPFLRLGLVDTLLTPKPGLAAWDSLFARRYAP
jgi:hypothetical protein